MLAGHGITHEIKHHLAVRSGAGGLYFDRICSPDLSTPLFVAIFIDER